MFGIEIEIDFSYDGCTSELAPSYIGHYLLNYVPADRTSRSLTSVIVTSTRYETDEVGFHDPKCQFSVL